MTTYRSSILQLQDRHCARAMDFAEAGSYRERELFQAGIAAHAIIQACGENPSTDPRDIAEAVVRELVTKGRAFDGAPEAPMSPQQATQGREIALAYLATHLLSQTAKYEAGRAVDGDWQPCDYSSSKAYYRAAIDTLDVIEQEDDEGYLTKIVITTDWKSAWPTDASELETIQLRGQAAVAFAHHPDATVLRRRAVNLRTGAVYEADTVMDEAGLEQVRGWRRDIGHAIAAANVRQADGQRPARPGAGCYDCPYLPNCAAGLSTPAGEDAESMARQWMHHVANAQALRPILTKLSKESPIVTDGVRVGYTAKERRQPSTGAPAEIARAWLGDAPSDTVIGMLTAMQPGIGSIDEIAKTLHPFDRKSPTWKEDRAALVSACTETVTVAEFGYVKPP